MWELINFEPVGPHLTITDISAVTELVPQAGGTAVRVEVEAQDARYTIGQTAPTSTNGFTQKATITRIHRLQANSKIRYLELTSGAILQVQWGHIR